MCKRKFLGPISYLLISYYGIRVCVESDLGEQNGLTQRIDKILVFLDQAMDETEHRLN